VPARNPQVLADAIVVLSQDAELRARLKAAERRSVESQFSLDACGRLCVNIYRDITKVGRVPVQALIDAPAVID